jgi:hypothetical protein
VATGPFRAGEKTRRSFNAIHPLIFSERILSTLSVGGPREKQILLRDAEAVADPLDHGALGPVHPGFFEGLQDLWTKLKRRGHDRTYRSVNK